ncbi:MAG: aspartate aminotransferase family protein, partial [Thermoleophilaceae bacterium]
MTSGAATDAGREVVGRYARHVNRGRAKLAGLMGSSLEVASEGPYVIDQHDRRHLDCGGAGVFLIGHRHPRVVDAVIDQIGRHPLATRMLLEPRQGEAAERLAEVSPEGLDYVQFCTSGADAAEVGLKIARLHGRTRILGTHGGFHGKSLGALSATGHPFYRERFEPLLEGCEHVPFGDAGALAQALEAMPPGEACVVIEPVQSVGGVVIPPPGYLRAAREACTKHDALLVVDEIQTGLGRVGAWWAVDGEEVVPDILLAGKVLTGGVVPVAAVVTSDELMRPLSQDPLLHNTTFTGAPIAMAAALATIDVLQEEQMIDRARELGGRLLPVLREAVEQVAAPILVEVRGQGLLIGIELAAPHHAGDMVLELLQRRVLVNPIVGSRPVVSITPPAILGA